MEWQLVEGRHGKGKRRGWGGQPELKAIAEGIRAALMPQPHKREGQRKPEWRCMGCDTMNFMSRPCCRRCGTSMSSPAASGAKQPKKAPDQKQPTAASSRQAPAGPPKPAARVAALERAAAAAREGDAPVEAREAIERELAAAKAEVASARPLGARLDSARASVRRAKAKVETTEAALAKAKAQHEEAIQSVSRAEDELKALEDNVAAASGPQSGPRSGLLEEVRKLLGALEKRGSGLPDDVVDSMAQLHILAGTEEDAEAVEDEMRRDLGVSEPEPAAEDPATNNNLHELGAAELEQRLEKCHHEHYAALQAKQFPAAVALGGTLNRLTEALQLASA